MAYAATVSLMQILKKLLHSDKLPIPYPKSQIQSLYARVSFLHSILKMKNHVPTSGTSLVDELEIQIIDAIYEAEDIIESHISAHFLPSEYESSEGEKIFSQKLQKVLQQFGSISDNIDGSREKPRTRSSEPFKLSKFLKGKKRLVGHENDLMKLKKCLFGFSERLETVTVVGMVGIGKTTLVKEVYDDPFIRDYFEYRAWATVGPNDHVQDVLLSLLNPHLYQESRCPEDLGFRLYSILTERRYLIVLDNMCDINKCVAIRRYFPDDHKGSRVILTTRLRNVAPSSGYVHQVGFLDEDESWDLLRHAAIGDQESCPFELVKIGKTIAHNCQGLPLKIIVLGSLLSRMSLDPEMWSSVANNHEIQNHEMLKITQNLDHEQLPQLVKACFLYMVAFPLYQQISVSKLFKLWIAEGFLEPKRYNTLEVVAKECLEDLVARSLILVHKSSSMGRIKKCSIHSAIWPFYHRAAVEQKVVQAIESYKDCADPTQRRFSIHKNILFAIKDVYDSVASVSTTRSLLCTGPYHPYPLRVILSFRLLRVLDALSIRFYEFPVGILKLVLLRFLGLTLNTGELPASVSNLGQLQFLIVRRHSSITSSGAPSFLPMEIWNMKELRHLQFMGSDLPAPPCDDVNAFLPNLATVSDVSALSCTRDVFERTPNLKKLGIVMELAWDAAATPLLLFDHLARLQKLEVFKCVVMNHVLGSQVAFLPHSVSNFPSTLKRITLSGCGFSWENVKEIGRLRNLQVLKLQMNAFQGPEWEVNEVEFCSLRSLELEDMDVEKWRADYGSFLKLEHLAIQHCYKLHEIPLSLELTLQTIKVVDCSPSVVDSARRILAR